MLQVKTQPDNCLYGVCKGIVHARCQSINGESCICCVLFAMTDIHDTLGSLWQLSKRQCQQRSLCCHTYTFCRPADAPQPSIQATLHHVGPLTPAQLAPCAITQQDFETAVKKVQPSVRREGFATTPDVTWSDVGSLAEVSSQSHQDSLKFQVTCTQQGLHCK